VRRYFDLVLVHGDPALIPFDETFPRAAEIAARLRYTGYVVDPPTAAAPVDGAGVDEVVVSTGGGAVSEPLLDAALAARPLSALADAPWRLLVGHNLPDDRFAHYRAQAAPGVIVERSRPDFTALLPHCRLSISQGGYNTVMEVLAAGARAVCVPYSGGLETEQTLRCRLLAERGVLQMVEEDALTPQALAAAVARALAAPPAGSAGVAANIAMDGTARSAAYLLESLASRPGNKAEK
jgi:predicted glycosyltransferase